MPTRGFPGPGTYESPKRPSTGIKIGSEKRAGLGGKGDSPGPGHYNIESKVGKEGKGVIITSRHEEKKDINQVGPGQYQMPTTLSGPKFSMGTGEKGTKLNKDAVQNPPPGTYTVEGGGVKHSSPGVKFGRDTRDKTKPDGLPGPGNYTIPSTMEKKGITIQGKYEEKIKEKAPGPGAYESKMSPSKTHGGGVKFGHEAKGTGPKMAESPGPAMYKYESPYKGGHKFGREPKGKENAKDVPGPGQYNLRKEEGFTYY